MKVSRAKVPNIRYEEEECSNKREALNSCLGELKRDVQHAQKTLVLPQQICLCQIPTQKNLRDIRLTLVSWFCFSCFLHCKLCLACKYTSVLFSSIYCIPYKMFLRVDQYEAYPSSYYTIPTGLKLDISPLVGKLPNAVTSNIQL